MADEMVDYLVGEGLEEHLAQEWVKAFSGTAYADLSYEGVVDYASNGHTPRTARRLVPLVGGGRTHALLSCYVATGEFERDIKVMHAAAECRVATSPEMRPALEVVVDGGAIDHYGVQRLHGAVEQKDGPERTAAVSAAARLARRGRRDAVDAVTAALQAGVEDYDRLVDALDDGAPLEWALAFAKSGS